MIHEFIGDLGHLFVVTSFISALFAAISYLLGTQCQDLVRKQFWVTNGRWFFHLHAMAVVGIVVSLFVIIYNHYFEYHYAWSHSSRRLPTHYMISCFWEGQEGSFLLWLFWNALLGIILIYTNKFWESPIMTVFAFIQVFLASMILGVVIPGLNVKIGSSPFILLRDAMDAPIFKEQPNFIPKDGTGLNPLLQNYWMVIHPPTLFLGFATTAIPFAYCLAGLWIGRFREWIRPALPWALFSGAVLGLGILMGGYWAYETLNFGGYWNWDPVENAIYVPWLFLVASIHTMITFKNSETALKASIILVITTFVLILYSTFLVRSGILGNSSVHSFTDLGLSGQLLLYLLFFTVGAIILSIVRWKYLPSSETEASTYSRELWVFVGALVLCLMGFHVLVPTSIPVWNTIVELFGKVSNVAPPTEPMEFYSRYQIYFASAVAILSAVGQFFWWKKMDKEKLWNSLTIPVIITLIVTMIIVLIGNVGTPQYILLLVSGVFTIVANSKILINVLKKSPGLSGGAIAHIGIGLMLIGILFSAGYSKVVSLNNTGMLISRESSDEFNNENLFLFINQPKQMAGYEILYRGERIEPLNGKGYISKNDVRYTSAEHLVVAKRDIMHKGDLMFAKNDTIEIAPENTFYEVEYKKDSTTVFTLYPRAQVNPSMGGLLASPDIKRRWGSDLYTHVSTIRDPNEKIDWSELIEFEVSMNQTFFVNDYVAEVIGMERIPEVDGVVLEEEDVAVKATISVQGEQRTYTSQPIFLIKNGMVGRIADEINDLGIRFTLLNIYPDKNSFAIGANTRQKDYVVIKAMEKPLINVLWIGTLVLMAGFAIATKRRYGEFKKMREKGTE